jgi:hypothetical protein
MAEPTRDELMHRTEQLEWANRRWRRRSFLVAGLLALGVVVLMSEHYRRVVDAQQEAELLRQQAEQARQRAELAREQAELTREQADRALDDAIKRVQVRMRRLESKPKKANEIPLDLNDVLWPLRRIPHREPPHDLTWPLERR